MAHEDAKYCCFLKNNMPILNDPLKRKNKRVFHRMAAAIRSRDAGQCRSHHQKMTVRFGEIIKIIEYLEGDYLDSKSGEGERQEEEVGMDGTAESMSLSDQQLFRGSKDTSEKSKEEGAEREKWINL